MTFEKPVKHGVNLFVTEVIVAHELLVKLPLRIEECLDGSRVAVLQQMGFMRAGVMHGAVLVTDR